MPSPYEIRNGLRYIRGTNNFFVYTAEGIKIIAIDSNHKESLFTSISDCANKLNLDMAKIKRSLLTGVTYKNLNFKVCTDI